MSRIALTCCAIVLLGPPLLQAENKAEADLRKQLAAVQEQLREFQLEHARMIAKMGALDSNDKTQVKTVRLSRSEASVAAEKLARITGDAANQARLDALEAARTADQAAHKADALLRETEKANQSLDHTNILTNSTFVGLLGLIATLLFKAWRDKTAHDWVVEETKKNTEQTAQNTAILDTVRKNTNSLAQQLVDKTAKSSYEDGLKAGREETG